MNFFSKAKEEEFEGIGLKDLSKSVRVLEQTGTTKVRIDAKRKALAPGKRISSSGKVYWETRKNRSDKVGKRI